MTLEYSRKDRMAKRCTHREYYAQFVNDNVKARVIHHIGIDNLQNNADSPHFNNIPLQMWDDVGVTWDVMQLLKTANGKGGVSLSDLVCVNKEAARQIIEESEVTQ